jgi:hypothetical protein
MVSINYKHLRYSFWITCVRSGNFHALASWNHEFNKLL